MIFRTLLIQINLFIMNSRVIGTGTPVRYLSWISDACPNDLSQSKNYDLSQSKNEKSTFLHFYIFTEKYLFEWDSE